MASRFPRQSLHPLPRSRPAMPQVRLRASPRARWRLVAAALILALTTLAVVRRLRMTPEATLEANMAACEPAYETIDPHHAHDVMHRDPSEIPFHSRTAIAIVSLHDTRKLTLPHDLSEMTGIEPGKAVDTLEVVWRNRRDYAERHGYTLIDGTQHRGNDRRASWYKIKVRPCRSAHCILSRLVGCLRFPY